MQNLLFYSSLLHYLQFKSSFFMIFFVILYGLTQVCYRKFPPQHQYRRHYHQLGRPPPPFSVSLQDAIITKSFFLLSAIRIPPAWCPSFIQHWIKMITFTKHNQDLLRLHHRKRYGYKGLSLCLLPFLYFSLSHQRLMPYLEQTMFSCTTNHHLIYTVSKTT